MDPVTALGRYRPLVDDWDAFLASVSRPLPPCVWIRPVPGAAAGTHIALAEDDLEGRPVGWFDGALHPDREPDPPRSLAYRAGLVHVMEEVSMLPVAMLDPRPGERILDLCAAPGNKTALVAARMDGMGTVVANDVSGGRQSVTRTTLLRLGLANVTVTCRDGTDPAWAGLGFDRVLVDAPCSCEGTVRKHPDAACRTSPHGRAKLADLQRRLLASAVRACSPGGLVVYSTCTFAPEENEEVVDDVMRSLPGLLRPEATRVPGLATDPGILSWNGRRFDPGLRNAVRVWPHRQDTGGFFCVALRRTGRPAAAAAYIRSPSWLDRRDPEVVNTVDPILEHFSIAPRHVERYRYLASSARTLSIAAVDHDPRLPFRAVSTGLDFVRRNAAVPKLATAGVIALGRRATRNVLDLDRRAVFEFVARSAILLDTDVFGHQIVRWHGHPIGLGLVRRDTAGVRLESLYPRTWAGLQPIRSLE